MFHRDRNFGSNAEEYVKIMLIYSVSVMHIVQDGFDCTETFFSNLAPKPVIEHCRGALTV